MPRLSAFAGDSRGGSGACWCAARFRKQTCGLRSFCYAATAKDSRGPPVLNDLRRGVQLSWAVADRRVLDVGIETDVL